MKIKSILSILGAALIASSVFSACEGPTEITPDTMPGKITVCGFVRYLPTLKTGAGSKTVVELGTTVNIEYTLGKATHLYQTKTLQDGSFVMELGCPLNESVDIAVSARIEANAYINEVTQTALYYGEVSHTISEGSAYNFDLILTPKAGFGKPGANL